MKPHRPILLARIGAAHGVRGEVRVLSFTADPMDFAAYGPLFDDGGRKFEPVALRLAKNVVISRIKGIADRNAAEALNGTDLFVDRSALPQPVDAGEYLAHDLIGLRVVTHAGAPFGVVDAIWNHGAGDILEIKQTAGGSELYAFTARNFPSVDLEGRVMIIEPPDIAPDDTGEKESRGKE